MILERSNPAYWPIANGIVRRVSERYGLIMLTPETREVIDFRIGDDLCTATIIGLKGKGNYEIIKVTTPTLIIHFGSGKMFISRVDINTDEEEAVMILSLTA
jgi:hypothetical protein